MAFGGGTFIAQNKVLPGSYLNFVSAGRASETLSDRGVAALPLTLSWGPVGEVFAVSSEDFMTRSARLLGYDYTAPEMLGLRELFLNARMGLFYRLGSGGVAAENNYCIAKYPGVCGNKITTVVSQNPDGDEGVDLFDVKTLFDGRVVDIQKGIADASELVANDFVVWKDSTLASTAGMPLNGGEDGVVSNGEYQSFLDAIESYAFHTLGLVSEDPTLCGLFAAFTRRMREDVGAKFQTVLYRYGEADYEGVISVENGLTDTSSGNAADLVYWVTGAQAGCAVNQSLTGSTYNGGLTVDVNLTQSQLENILKKGGFVLHRAGERVCVLQDVNTFTSVSTDKNADFSDNQVVRVLDQIGNDIALMFNERYLGKVANDEAGRTGLWSDIVAHHKALEAVRAIEDFDAQNVKVEQGATKKSIVVVDKVTPVCAMAQLYMTVVVE